MHVEGGWGQARRDSGRGRSVWAGVTLLALVVALAAPAQAIPRDPILPPIDDVEIPFVPPDGFDWSVPSRFGARHNGLVDFHWNDADGPLRWGTQADREKYNPEHVHPDKFPMNFDACPTQEERDATEAGQPTTNTYEWLVDGGPYPARHTCELNHEFDAQGEYDVTLTVRDEGGEVVGSYDRQVYVKDFLIVSIGDSYASGEGNPDIPQRVGGPHNTVVLSEARWVDRRCHRSANAASAQAARLLEAADPKTSVTFLSFACSGATINRQYFGAGNDLDPYEPPPPGPDVDRKPIGSGVLGTYQGAEPPDPDDYDDHLPSQIDQVKAAVGDRRIDALTMSAGGNDIGFGPIAAVCVLFDDCPNHRVWGAFGEGPRPLHQRFGQDLAAMAARYAALDAALADPANGLDIAETFITEYPDPTGDETGTRCQVMLEDVIKPLFWGAVPFHITGSEIDFAAGPVLDGLNGAVRDASDAYDWTLVGGIAAAYDRHGYCSKDGWIRRAVDSARMQGPYDFYPRDNPFEYGPFPPDTAKTKGTLHPTTRGLRAVAERLVEEMRPVLYATVPGPAPTATFSTDLTAGGERAVEGDNGWLIGACEVTSATTCTTDYAVLTVDADDSADIVGTALSLDGEPVPCEAPWCTATRPASGRHRWTFRLGEGIHRLDFTVSGPDRQVASFSHEAKVDLSDPTASASLASPEPANGWFAAPAQVALSGADTGSGIAALESRVNGGGFTAGPQGQSLVDLDTDGVHTVEYRAVDWAGRRSEIQSLTVRVDQTPPQVDCAASDGQWHVSDVTVACSVTETGSGLSDPADADLSLTTSVPGGTETADAHTGSRQVCDVAGNCAVAGPVGGHKVDRKAPAITIAVPGAADVFLLGEPGVADYTCVDGGSGLGDCTGPVPTGTNIDTATVGPKRFTVDAADAVGNTSSRSHAYEVHYDFSGFLSPVAEPPTVNDLKAGMTVPVKFGLAGDQGLAVLAPGSPSSQKIACDSSAPMSTVEEATTAGSSGLSYDAGADQYVYRWKTDKSWSGTCRVLRLDLADGTTRRAWFQFR